MKNSDSHEVTQRKRILAEVQPEDILLKECVPMVVGVLGGAFAGGMVGGLAGVGVFEFVGLVFGSEVGVLLYLHRMCGAHYATLRVLTGISTSRWVIRAASKAAITGAVIGAVFGKLGFGGPVIGGIVVAVLGAIAGGLAAPVLWYMRVYKIIVVLIGVNTYEALFGASLPRL